MYSFSKRLFDIISSAIALICLSPVLIGAAIAIVVSDPGPVFYMANRVGKDDKVFKMFKFRSMRVDRTANEKSFKADTNRIFPWGQFMRDSKIDELPQLINILLGDMSVIGPRPASVDQVDRVRAGKYAATSALKPGLSGPSALYDYIYGDTIEDEKEYEEKVLPTRLDLDLYYTQKKSFWYDMKIIWYTVVCIVMLVSHNKPDSIFEELLEAAESVR